MSKFLFMKIGIFGSLGAILLAEIGTIPISWALGASIAWNLVFGTWKALDFMLAYVAGSVKPGKDATPAQLQFYRRSRLFFHLPVDLSEEE